MHTSIYMLKLSKILQRNKKITLLQYLKNNIYISSSTQHWRAILAAFTGETVSFINQLLLLED